MQVLREEPSLRKEAIVVRELLLKALQVDGESVLAGNVVHAEEVVDSLVRLQL